MKKYIILGIGLFLTISCSNNPTGIINPDTVSSPKGTATPTPILELGFPFSNPDLIERIAPFGEPNWSGTEPHNGTDLICNTTVASAELIAPISGRITRIEMRENPYSNPINQLMVDVTLEATSSFVVNLVIEPSTTDAATKTQQQAAISVSENQWVNRGDRIGDLIIGNLGYPHLHYMLSVNNQVACAYQYSTDTAKVIFDTIAARSSSEICK